MTLADYALIFGALGLLVAGFAFAIHWIDSEEPRPLIDHVGAHLAEGTPIVTVRPRTPFYDQDQASG